MINKTYTSLLFVLAMLLLSLGTAHAQHDDFVGQDTARGNGRILKIHPLQIGEVYLSHEKMRTGRISNEFGISYIYRSFLKGDEWLPEGTGVQGMAIRMSQRKYTSKRAAGSPIGFFHGPMFGYRLLIFERNVFGLPPHDPRDPESRVVGRLYENALDLTYQLGAQFKLSDHLTAEAAAGIGGRVKYVRSTNAGELLTEHIIGHAVVAESNSAIFAMPLPQVKLSVGYAF